MLANSGAGLVIVEATHVERHGRITHGCMALYSDESEAALKRVVDFCRRAGTAKLGIQHAHAGRKASVQRPWEGGGSLKPGQDPWATIGPSAQPFGPGWHTPRAMAADDLARVRGAFAAAAQRAVRIGFDAIELHMAHGYLAHSFMSPISNERTDQYGGSLENRMRFPREITEAVRHVVPRTIALGAPHHRQRLARRRIDTGRCGVLRQDAQGRRPGLCGRLLGRHFARCAHADDAGLQCRDRR
jgi:NADPH2 dehydrogenase